MFLRVARRLSYLIPLALITWLCWLGDLSWLAAALLAGGSAFAVDRLWGVPGAGIRASLATTGGGLLCLMAAFYLANGSSLSLGEYFQLVTKVPRNQRLQYYLPVLGAGLIFYGLLGYGRAWLLQRDKR